MVYMFNVNIYYNKKGIFCVITFQNPKTIAAIGGSSKCSGRGHVKLYFPVYFYINILLCKTWFYICKIMTVFDELILVRMGYNIQISDQSLFYSVGSF